MIQLLQVTSATDSGSYLPIAIQLIFAVGLIGVLILAGISFGPLLPFLALSLANRFYRERLKGLLHLGCPETPPIIAPPTIARKGMSNTASR